MLEEVRKLIHRTLAALRMPVNLFYYLLTLKDSVKEVCIVLSDNPMQKPSCF